MEDGAPAHCSTKVQVVVSIEPAGVLKKYPATIRTLILSEDLWATFQQDIDKWNSAANLGALKLQPNGHSRKSSCLCSVLHKLVASTPKKKMFVRKSLFILITKKLMFGLSVDGDGENNSEKLAGCEKQHG